MMESHASVLFFYNSASYFGTRTWSRKQLYLYGEGCNFLCVSCVWNFNKVSFSDLGFWRPMFMYRFVLDVGHFGPRFKEVGKGTITLEWELSIFMTKFWELRKMHLSRMLHLLKNFKSSFFCFDFYFSVLKLCDVPLPVVFEDDFASSSSCSSEFAGSGPVSRFFSGFCRKHPSFRSFINERRYNFTSRRCCLRIAYF